MKQRKLTQLARVYDPDPRRRSKMCNCMQMRVPEVQKWGNCRRMRKTGVQECATVSNSMFRIAFGACKNTCFVPVFDSCTFLSPTREFWSREGCHNRIRHVDPPPNQSLKLTQRARVYDPDPRRRGSGVHKCATVCKCELLGS